ncbi:MAG: rRNA maturation RNase YbeY [Ferruginibacter sp.]
MKIIQFFDYDRNPRLSNKNRLRDYIYNLFIKEKLNPKSISYIFCSDNHIIKINKEFLNHNYYTDVISFDLSESPSAIEAEIYISIDRVVYNANKEGVSFKEELHRVIFHGTLHLCGYKDKKIVEVLRMRKKENRCLSEYFNVKD